MKIVSHMEFQTACNRFLIGGLCKEKEPMEKNLDFFNCPTYRPNSDTWLVTNRAAKRIRLLCSPHWKTVIKIWKINETV
jgi:hypothetical protein